EGLMDDAGHPLVQRQSALADPREQGLEPGSQPLHRVHIHRPGRAFQTVRSAERLVEFGSSLRFRHIFEHRKDRADMFQVLGVLALKNGGEFLANVDQSWYCSVARGSWAPRLVRLGRG